MKTIAIILAAGKGERMGNTTPKQFLLLKNKTILEWSIEAFQRNEKVDEIAIMIDSTYHGLVEKLVAGYSKVKVILEGGSTRSETTQKALQYYTDDDDILLLHDAARPLVTQNCINECIGLLNKDEETNVVIPTLVPKDTLYEVGWGTMYPNEVLDRAYTFIVQTPQVFYRGTLAKAYVEALKDPDFECTDDGGVIINYGDPLEVLLAQGDECNIKITTPIDLKIAEVLCNQ